MIFINSDIYITACNILYLAINYHKGKKIGHSTKNFILIFENVSKFFQIFNSEKHIMKVDNFMKIKFLEQRFYNFFRE